MYRTLLVEDDVGLRVLTKTVLERTGRFIVVGESGDGDEAVVAAARLQPDLILLDLAMPKVDGLDALPRLRAGAPKAVVVALSMLQRERYESEVVQRGAVAFLDKGLDSKQLVARLLAILDPQQGQSGSRSPPFGSAKAMVPPWGIARRRAPAYWTAP